MDRFVADFQLLRLTAGDISYAQIAERVRRLREARGMSEAAAYVGRSTVYDAFRAGRRRINARLVADIATVLGEDAERAAYWRDYCVRARAEEVGQATPATPAVPASPPEPAPAPAQPVPGPRGEAAIPPVASRPVVRSFLLASTLIVALGVAANMAGSIFVRALGLPLYLDMVGTAIASVTLGPWYGVAVAILTHGLFALFEWTLVGIPFTVVNIAGALVWGYGVRQWRMGRSPSRVLVLSLLVGVCCTLVATLLIMFVYGGFSINAGAHTLSGNLVAIGHQIWSAVFSSNIITSLMDKLISGFIALALLPLLVRHLAGRPDHAIQGLGRLFSGRPHTSGAS
ncbi:helix-turn-helix domain-containing protein [Microbacterium sp. zg.Y909]|uniref:helix-turn-helix domain-containing protein n=1 Tax=Microbacterium sp. zg.Y909 TaxID=2969413 RepID=UPI00214C755B|nr:helix-turn-helix transcriptional regulator [Microbacterium sp. zg.Y909]MCR2824955.1 helix-turn-helix transcriptional regulator [Microbacterium sp. zg.Y909]